MQTKDKAEEIKRACILANESIKDLVMGCEVWCNYWSFEATRETIVGIHENGTDDKGYYCALRKDYTHKNYFIEIIGREIRLAEILGTINVNSDKNYAVDNFGIFLREESMGTFKTIHEIVKWNLTHDSLSWHAENAPETISFIHSLLPKK